MTILSLKHVSSLLETEWSGLPEKELREKLQAEANRYPDEIIIFEKKAKPGVIWFNNIKFELESGKLKRIN